jgi:hypothetical protein
VFYEEKFNSRIPVKFSESCETRIYEVIDRVVEEEPELILGRRGVQSLTELERIIEPTDEEINLFEPDEEGKYTVLKEFDNLKVISGVIYYEFLISLRGNTDLSSCEKQAICLTKYTEYIHPYINYKPYDDFKDGIIKVLSSVKNWGASELSESVKNYFLSLSLNEKRLIIPEESVLMITPSMLPKLMFFNYEKKKIMYFRMF